MLKSEKIRKYFITLTSSNGSIWKTIKKLINHRNNTPPLERSDKSLAVSDLDEADIFVNMYMYLFSIFSPNPELNSKLDHNNLVN